jgi:hypothetical protein
LWGDVGQSDGVVCGNNAFAEGELARPEKRPGAPLGSLVLWRLRSFWCRVRRLGATLRLRVCLRMSWGFGARVGPRVRLL